MLNIVVPMAGHGSRFQEMNYKQPKPLIPVYGAPMMEVVVNNLRPERPHRFIFICRRDHLRRYELAGLLNTISPGCQIINTESVTAGAACTVLLASDFIDNSQPLMIANCDQWINARIDDYLEQFDASNLDGYLMTMTSQSSKWSYVKRDPSGSITRVVEKQVVSDEATVGIYNFARGEDFVRGAQAMIVDDERVRGEFYVAPVYSRLIQEGKQIETMSIGSDQNGMHGLGTPEDLQAFLKKDFGQRLRAETPIHKKAA